MYQVDNLHTELKRQRLSQIVRHVKLLMEGKQIGLRAEINKTLITLS